MRHANRIPPFAYIKSCLRVVMSIPFEPRVVPVASKSNFLFHICTNRYEMSGIAPLSPFENRLADFFSDCKGTIRGIDSIRGKGLSRSRVKPPRR